jgi:hypothetical protein
VSVEIHGRMVMVMVTVMVMVMEWGIGVGILGRRVCCGEGLWRGELWRR